MKPTEYHPMKGDLLTPQDRTRMELLQRLESEGYFLIKNAGWYNRGIELIVFCLLGLLSVAAFVAVIFGLIYMGRLAFGA